MSGSLPIGNEFEEVTATFEHLNPNSTYHYALLAENEYGNVETGDRTLDTELSAAEERQIEVCPVNGTVHGEERSTLREENHSLALPDCRAYEQASEPKKEGAEVFPGEFALPAGGNRVYYFSQGAFDGAAQNELAIQYIGRRSESGWSTLPLVSKRLTPPGEEPVTSVVISPELDRWLTLIQPGINAEQARVAQTTSYLAMGFSDGTYDLHASATGASSAWG